MYIKVKVTASARAEKVVKKSDDEYLISVKQKPERNMANTRVIEIIAGLFNIPINKVRIINGHHQNSKMLSIMI